MQQSQIVTGEDEFIAIARVDTICPVCTAAVFGASGRGFCPDCFITFPLPKATRKSVMDNFVLQYYMSKSSPFYHRAGCKYIKNISTENLITVIEPAGKACRCVH